MSEKSGSVLDDIFGFAEEAAGLASTITVKNDERALRSFEPEPVDHGAVVHLRRLIEHTGASFTKEVDCFRVTIGLGASLRVYDASTVGGAIHAACEGEKLVIPASSGPPRVAE